MSWVLLQVVPRCDTYSIYSMKETGTPEGVVRKSFAVARQGLPCGSQAGGDPAE